MIVLDTHAWVWWVGDPSNLSGDATEAIENAARERALYVSSISVWEVSMLVCKGRLLLTADVADWVAQSEALPYLQFVPVDNHVALRSTDLPEPAPFDPADRIIVATALTLGARLVSKDEGIRKCVPDSVVW